MGAFGCCVTVRRGAAVPCADDDDELQHAGVQDTPVRQLGGWGAMQCELWRRVPVADAECDVQWVCGSDRDCVAVRRHDTDCGVQPTGVSGGLRGECVEWVESAVRSAGWGRSRGIGRSW